MCSHLFKISTVNNSEVLIFDLDLSIMLLSFGDWVSLEHFATVYYSNNQLHLSNCITKCVMLKLAYGFNRPKSVFCACACGNTVAALDVKKQKDLSGFYRHLLNQTVGEERIPDGTTHR